MVKSIIVIAVLAFLIVLTVIYFDEIKNFIKSKLSFFKKKKPKEQKPEKPKEKEKSKAPTWEEFKPIYKDPTIEERDLSIERLFADEEFPLDETIGDPLLDDGEIVSESNIPLEPQRNFKDLDKEFESMFKKRNKTADGDQTISQKIKNLPPEIKALLVDNVLKKRDDV